MFGSQIVTDSSLLLLESSIGYSLYIQKKQPFQKLWADHFYDRSPMQDRIRSWQKVIGKLDRFHHTDWYISPWFGVRLFNTPFSSILVEDTVQKVQLWSSMALKPQQTEICLPTNKFILVSTQKDSKYLCKSIMVHSWSISDLLPKKTVAHCLKLTYIDPESQCLEDDRFLLGPVVFWRAILVSGRVLPRISFEK